MHAEAKIIDHADQPLQNEEMMAKYKPYSQAQESFIPVFFNKQLQKGTFEYTLNYLVDPELDISFFDKRYNTDETGAPAYDPHILIKGILFAYSRGDHIQSCHRRLPFLHGQEGNPSIWDVSFLKKTSMYCLDG